MEMETYPISHSVHVVRVHGDLDGKTAETFFDGIAQIIDDGKRKLIIDCGRLGYVSSVGIAALMRTHARMKAKGGNVKLAALQSVVQSVLTTMRLDRVFDMYESIEGANVAFMEEKKP